MQMTRSHLPTLIIINIYNHCHAIRRRRHCDVLIYYLVKSVTILLLSRWVNELTKPIGPACVVPCLFENKLAGIQQLHSP